MDITRIIGLIAGTPLLVILSLVLSVFLFFGLLQLLKGSSRMNFPLFIAGRYLFGKSEDQPLAKRIWIALKGFFPKRKSRRDTTSPPAQNAINIITSISMLAIMVVTAALILVLSVFNGFQNLIEDMYTSFDPDVRVEAAAGKMFAESDSLAAIIRSVDGVSELVPTVEGKAMMTYYDRQEMGVIKGVAPEYYKVDPLDQLVYEGQFAFTTPEGYPGAVFGGTLAYFLNAHISDRSQPVKVWTAAEDADPLKNPEAAYQAMAVFPTGYFRVQLEYDSKYVLMALDSARKLLGCGDKITAYEIKVADFSKAFEVRDRIQAAIGENYRVISWYEQHEALFKVMQNEKFVAYLILTLMLLIAGVNIIGGLSMIVVEKTRDIGILGSMGASRRMIQRIFITEGFLVGAIGGTAGMIAAFVFGFMHENFGLIPLAGGESYGDLEFFPFAMHLKDFVLIFFTVFGLSILAAIFPARKASRILVVEALRK